MNKNYNSSEGINPFEGKTIKDVPEDITRKLLNEKIEEEISCKRDIGYVTFANPPFYRV